MTKMLRAKVVDHISNISSAVPHGGYKHKVFDDWWYKPGTPESRNKRTFGRFRVRPIDKNIIKGSNRSLSALSYGSMDIEDLPACIAAPTHLPTAHQLLNHPLWQALIVRTRNSWKRARSLMVRDTPNLTGLRPSPPSQPSTLYLDTQPSMPPPPKQAREPDAETTPAEYLPPFPRTIVIPYVSRTRHLKLPSHY